MVSVLKPLVRMLPKAVQLEAFAQMQSGQLFKPRPKGLLAIHHPEHYGLVGMQPRHILTPHGGLLPVWYLPPTAPDAPLCIAFHGNTGHWADVGPVSEANEQRDYRLHWLRAIQQRGTGIIAVHMPGFGLNHEETPSEENFRIAINSLLDFLDEHALRSHPLIITGESMGAAFATMTAVHLGHHGITPQVLGLIAPFASMAQRVADDLPALTAAQITEVLEHPLDVRGMLAHLPKSIRLYIAHPEQDTTTQPYHSEHLRDAAAEHGLRTHHEVLPNASHIVWDAAYVVQQMLSFRQVH